MTSILMVCLGKGGTTNISILYCAKPFCFNLKSALLNGYNGFELAWVRGGIRKAWTKHLLHDFFFATMLPRLVPDLHSGQLIKLRYCEKATKFEKSHTFLYYLVSS